MKPRRSAILLIGGLSRWVLGLTFLASGILKLAEPHEFGRSLIAFHLFPIATVAPVAILLPWVEVTAAVGLLAIPPLRKASTVLLLSLLLAFTALLGLTLARGLSPDCSCLGSMSMFAGSPLIGILRNVVLLSLALTALVSADSLVVGNPETSPGSTLPRR